MVVRRVLERGVGDRQLEAVAEDLQLGLVELLGLVRDVAGLDAGAEGPALHGVGEDDRGRTGVLGRRLVRGVDLAIVVAAAAELGEVVVAEMLDELLQARVGPEEVLADVGAARDRELLELPVERLVHLLDEEAVHVPGEEVVPFAAPDDLDDVPARATERGFELLDDLAVAADRAVEPLQVAVDDEGQVVEPLAGRHVEAAQALGLVGLAVAEERPDARPRGVEQTAIEEVAVVARLVDGAERPEPHRDRGELPEVGHEPGVRVGTEARGGARLAPEVVELVDAEATLEERARVDARRRVALVEDLVAAAAAVLAPEEMVEPDLVERGRGGIRGEVPTDPRELVVGAQDHGDRVPADQPADPSLHLLVARERRLLFRADRVDVAGLGQGRQPDLELAGALEELVDDEAGPGLALVGDHLVERLEPVLGLLGVDVGELMLELVEIHLGQLGCNRRVVGAFSALSIPGVPPLPAYLRASAPLVRAIETGSAAGTIVAPRSRSATWTRTDGLAIASRYQRASGPRYERMKAWSPSTTTQMIVRWGSPSGDAVSISISSVSSRRARSPGSKRISERVAHLGGDGR